MDLQQFNL